MSVCSCVYLRVCVSICVCTSSADDAFDEPTVGVSLGGDTVWEVDISTQEPHHVSSHLYPVREGVMVKVSLLSPFHLI